MGPTRSSKQHSAQNKSTLPGVQKIKSAIRQTTRFLAQGKLKADVRIETERRLASLQADLAQAEQARQEQALAVRYHKVKFFERKKVYRKIIRTKREISDSSTNDETRRKLDESLFEYRVDLNYVLNFPKLKKYVSLFPPTQATSDDRSSSKSASKTISETDTIREEVREWVRTSMKNGGLSMEPELTLGRDTNRTDDVGGGSNNRTTSAENEVDEEEEEEESDSE